jgi:hypothetical protein
MKKGWFIGAVVAIVLSWQLFVVFFETPKQMLYHVGDDLEFYSEDVNPADFKLTNSVNTLKTVKFYADKSDISQFDLKYQFDFVKVDSLSSRWIKAYHSVNSNWLSSSMHPNMWPTSAY